MQLADAFGERGGAGLEDVGRFDFVDMVVADGGDFLPAGAGANEILVHFHSAPGGDDYVGGLRDYGGRVDDAALRTLLETQVREDGLAAGNFYEFFDPADAGDERFFPFFEKYPGSAGQGFGGFRDFGQTGAEFGYERFTFRFRAYNPGQGLNHVQNFGHASLIEGEDGYAPLEEFAYDVGLEV